MSRDFDWPEFLFLLGALRWTVVLSLIAFLGGGIGGALAIARTSSHASCVGSPPYIGVIQGTPV
jgi:polar amino acid transport system permease protein